MEKSKKTIDQKIKEHLDQEFARVGPSQPLFELKEELSTNMKEKIGDYQSKGMDQQQAFTEAVISMGDLSGLVEDMRKHGQKAAKQSVYNGMAMRISNGGIVGGALLVLFGIFTSAMQYFMDYDLNATVGSSIFIVAGGSLLTYSGLIRETKKRYGMNQVRAGLYALAVGLLLFGLFVFASTFAATSQTGIAISSLMVFFLTGVGIYLYLHLTEKDRRKDITD